MKVLVTGASGFLGREIVCELEQNDFEVIKVGSLQSSDSVKLDLKIDIANKIEVAKLEKFTQVDAIIHCAGLAHQFGKIDEKKFFEVNVDGTVNVVESGVKHKIKHFILISSVSVYGDHSANSTEFINEKNVCRPQGIYADSKYKSELAATQLCEQFRIPLTILRPSTIIGESDKGNVSRLVKAIESGKFLWIGDGENKKSLVYKKDVAKACIHLLLNKNEQETEIFNITASPISMKEIVQEIELGVGKKVSKFVIKENYLSFLFNLNRRLFKINKVEKIAGVIQKWLSDEKFDGRKLYTVYGFSPQTKIREAISKQIREYLLNKCMK